MPTRSAKGTPCPPPAEFRPPWPHGRHHRAGVAASRRPHLHLTPIYTRSEGEIGKGLKALLGKGARPWPNPETVDAFKAVIAGELPTQTEVPTQAPMPITTETDDTLSANRKMLETPAVYTPELTSPSALSASDALFAKAEDLLELMGYSINEAKPKPRWDVHLPGAGNRGGSLAGVFRPLIAGPSGSAVSPRLSGWTARPGICRHAPAPPPCCPSTDCQ